MNFHNQNMPAWANGLATAIGENIRYKRDGNTDVRFLFAGEQSAPQHRLELAPAIHDVGSASYSTPEFELVDVVDLAAVQREFAETPHTVFQIADQGSPFFTFSGVVKGEPVEVLIYLEPFDDVDAA